MTLYAKCTNKYIKKKKPITDTKKHRQQNFGSVALTLPPFSPLRDFSFQNTSEHLAIRFRQSYLIWEVCDVTPIELSSKESGWRQIIP